MSDTRVDTPAEIVPIVEPAGQRAEQMPPREDPSAPKPGRWYWVIEEQDEGPREYKMEVVSDDDDLPDVSESDEEEEPEDDNPTALSTNTEPSRWFGCVTHVGSNYVELKGPFGKTIRVHEENFETTCVFEPNPDRVIRENANKQQAEVHELMAKVRDITARLAITNDPALPAKPEAGALAIYEGKSMDGYKTALVLAQEKTLPTLFSEIKNANHRLGKWLAAPIIPMQAEAEAMEPAIEKIKDRIFSVELYAGLCEEVEQIADGEPAGATEKVHLFQRRHYMDEECLAHYETGGMDFKNLAGFEKWLAKPVNLNRILPFDRCIAAFQIRRNRKHREMVNLSDYFRIREEEDADKMTFLYIRNGEQLFALRTKIEFGKKLFPDLGKQKLVGMLYAKVYSDGQVSDVITENEWLGMREDEAREERKMKEMKAHLKTLKGEAKREYEWKIPHYVDYKSKNYEPFNRENVYYDDILKWIQDEMSRHNRLVLVLQGLLDRSPVLHPHPPWQLWSADGFTAGLELIYDDSRALVAGELPSFKAFRDRLNSQLKPGDITVGQEDAWEIYEAAKESERRDRSWRYSREHYRPSRVRPPGNPGPGLLARVVKVNHKAGTVTYQWKRERQGSSDGGDIGVTWTTKMKNVLNVSAYRQGDFLQFFNDPRTRADYLQWACFLLEAEEYYAGNRKVREPVKLPKREKTGDGSYEYHQRKRRMALVGKAIRLNRDVTRRDGTVYKKGSLFRVTYHERGNFTIQGCLEDGTLEKPEDNKERRYVANMAMYELEVDPTIPPDADMEKRRLEEIQKAKDRKARKQAALESDIAENETNHVEDDDED